MIYLSSAPYPENITVLLEIDSGSFADGFEVTLNIRDNGKTIHHYSKKQIQLRLPPAPDIPDLFGRWRKMTLEGTRFMQHQAVKPGEAPKTEGQKDHQSSSNRIGIVDGQVTHINAEDWRHLTHELKARCEEWFEHQAFDHLSLKIQHPDEVKRDASVPIIIHPETDDEYQNYILSNLPWHEWKSLFSDLLNAEFALFGNFRRESPPLQLRVQILAIFGSSHGIDVDQDRQALALLENRGADIKQVVEPSETLLKQALSERAWDIVFFAGHSSSDSENGSIQINTSTILSLDALEFLLTRAVDKGLKLAIFNSCDGLSIARFLANKVKIPASIVMRQPVPDQIAGQFLLDFLAQFSEGIPLYRSVRLARERLPAHHDFPAADWLPTLCVNPNQPELIWPSSQPDRDASFNKDSSSSEQSQVNSWGLDKGRRQKAILFVLLGLIGFLATLSVGKYFISHKPKSGNTPPVSVIDTDPLVSQGENAVEETMIDLTDPYLSLKKQGIEAFQKGDYEMAFQSFNSLRQQAKRDKDAVNSAIATPSLAALQDYESLMYRNNALVLKRQQQNPDLPVYTIGLAAPFNFDAGVGIAYGVAHAQDVLVNEQGLNLLVTMANDSNNEAQAQVVAAELANDENILAVVGHYTSPNSCAALNQYNPAGLVLVAPTSTTVNLASRPECGGNSNQVFFRTVSTTRVEAETLVNYLIDELAIAQPNVAVFYNFDELFSRNLAEQFKQVINAYGGKTTAHNLANPDWPTDQLPADAQSADALVMLPDGGTNNRDAFDQAIDLLILNRGEKPVLGANTLYLKDVLEDVEAEALVNQLFIAVDWHPKQRGAEAFSQQVRDYWGGDLNRRTALAYEAVQAIAQAITLSAAEADNPTTDVTRQSIRQKLAGTGILPETAAKSATCKGMLISFDPLGDRNEITTRQIVTVAEHNGQLRFELATQDDCSSQ